METIRADEKTVDEAPNAVPEMHAPKQPPPVPGPANEAVGNTCVDQQVSNVPEFDLLHLSKAENKCVILRKFPW